MRIDGEGHRHAEAPQLSREMKDGPRLPGPRAHLEGSGGPGPCCSSGRSLGEAGADAPH
jgi:hypothetical protein